MEGLDRPQTAEEAAGGRPIAILVRRRDRIDGQSIIPMAAELEEVGSAWPYFDPEAAAHKLLELATHRSHL
jgi:hypothetical protein